MSAYNEANTIREMIKRVEAVDLSDAHKELIIVDDASKDGTREFLGDLRKVAPHKIYSHAQNKKKGAALRTALTYATGDIIVNSPIGDVQLLILTTGCLSCANNAWRGWPIIRLRHCERISARGRFAFSTRSIIPARKWKRRPSAMSMALTG
jgi:hypothetical protein